MLLADQEISFLIPLKTLKHQQIGLVLVTHVQGDHFDMWPVVRNLYPGCRLAAWRPVADVLEHPGDYLCACLLRW